LARHLIIDICYPSDIAQQPRRHMKRNLGGMGFTEGRKHLRTAAARQCGRLVNKTALADARRSRHIHDAPMTADGPIQHACDGVQFPLTSNQSGARQPHLRGPRPHGDQATSQDRFIGTLDTHHLRLTQSRSVINQSRGGRAKHHPTRRSDRLHPLSHPHLLTNRGVTERPRTDFPGDHLTGVQSNPQQQVDAVAVLDVGGKPVRLLLNCHRRQTRSNSVVLHCYRCAEHRHDPVTGELVHRAAIPLDHRRAALNQFGHDLAQPLGTDGRCNVHRMNNIGEQDGYLLVLSRLADVCDWRTALVTELGVRWQFGAARPTRQSSCCQCTATVLNAVHVSIVSPLLRDVRHIAVPSPIRSFGSLVSRFRDGSQ
jgi:hypothetical protein